MPQHSEPFGMHLLRRNLPLCLFRADPNAIVPDADADSVIFPVNGKPYLKKLILNENNNAIAQCRDLVAQYKALEPSGIQVFVIPTDTGFRKAQTTSVPVQAMSGTKKETMEALAEIAEALK